MNKGTSTKLSSLWKHGFLGFILCMLGMNMFFLLRWENFGYDQYLGPVVWLMLLFNHVAFYYTKTGRASLAMKTVAWTWIVVGFTYIFWVLQNLS